MGRASKRSAAQLLASAGAFTIPSVPSMQKKNNQVATATFTSIAVIVVGLLMIGMTSRAAEDIVGDSPTLTAGYAPRDSR